MGGRTERDMPKRSRPALTLAERSRRCARYTTPSHCAQAVSASAIGELIAPIMAKAERLRGVQVLIEAIASPAHQKRFVMVAREHGAITDEETGLLLTAHMLEEA